MNLYLSLWKTPRAEKIRNLDLGERKILTGISERLLFGASCLRVGPVAASRVHGSEPSVFMQF